MRGADLSIVVGRVVVGLLVGRPAGAAVHWHKGTVNTHLVAWMTLGSAPMAFLGAYLLSLPGNTPGAQRDIEYVLGAALLVGAGAMVFRDIQGTGPRRSAPRPCVTWCSGRSRRCSSAWRAA